MSKINLYLDDLRACPESFVLAKTVDEAIELIKNNKIGIMSLDHDLGNIDGTILPTGYDLVKYICEFGIECDTIFIHTDNPVGRESMYETLIGAQRRELISRDIQVYRYGYMR